MRNLLHLCFCLQLTYIISGQNNLTVKVVDAITGVPIKHCIISSDDTLERFLTNEEGIATFKISPGAVMQNYFYPGYERMSVPVTELVQSGIIALNKIPTKAADNNIIANEKIVLNRFTECRDLLQKAKIIHSKAYLMQSCFDQDEPIEILKYYYNSKLTGTRIVENDLKAGQFAFIADPDKIFLTLNNTKFYNETDWFTLKENFPATPFAYLPDQLYKKFAFKRMSLSEDKSDLHLTFEPFVQSGNSCSGEIIMDKVNKPQKIRIIARNSVNFPFEPIRDSDSISNVDFDLSYIFNPNQKDIQLELLELEYSFTIHSKTGAGNFTERHIRSKAVMHFYDFSQTFWIPNLIYNYPEKDAGYRITILVPYDSLFWVSNNSMKWSESQLQQIRYFEEKGVMFNFSEGVKVSTQEPDTLIPDLINYIQIPTYRWQTDLYFIPPTDTKYFSKVTTSLRANAHLTGKSKVRIKNYSHKPNMNIPGHIYLDLNRYDNIFIPTSHLLFMPESSIYYADGSAQSFAYFNIYMDIKELYRRRLIEEMMLLNTMDEMLAYCIKQWPKVYRKMKKIEKETRHGRNLKALAKWNAYLVREIGKDNFAFFGVGS